MPSLREKYCFLVIISMSVSVGEPLGTKMTYKLKIISINGITTSSIQVFSDSEEDH